MWDYPFISWVLTLFKLGNEANFKWEAVTPLRRISVFKMAVALGLLGIFMKKRSRASSLFD